MESFVELEILADDVKDRLCRLIYDGLQFVDPPTAFLCCNCGIVPIRHYLNPCKHLYCRDCYKQFQDNKRKCRKCESQIDSQSNQCKNTEFEIYKIKAFCPNMKFGCKEEIKFYRLLGHLDECGFTKDKLFPIEFDETKAIINEKHPGFIELKNTIEQMQSKISNLDKSNEVILEQIFKNTNLIEFNEEQVKENKNLVDINQSLTDHVQKLVYDNSEHVDRNMKLVQDNKEIFDNNQNLVKHIEELSNHNIKLTESFNVLIEENKNIVQENRNLADTMQKSRADNNDFKREIEKLINNNKNLVNANRKIAEENTKMAKDVDKIAAANQKAAKDNLKLVKDNEKSLTKNNKLVEENKKIVKEFDSIKSKMKICQDNLTELQRQIDNELKIQNQKIDVVNSQLRKDMEQLNDHTQICITDSKELKESLANTSNKLSLDLVMQTLKNSDTDHNLEELRRNVRQVNGDVVTKLEVIALKVETFGPLIGFLLPDERKSKKSFSIEQRLTLDHLSGQIQKMSHWKNGLGVWKVDGYKQKRLDTTVYYSPVFYCGQSSDQMRVGLDFDRDCLRLHLQLKSAGLQQDLSCGSHYRTTFSIVNQSNRKDKRNITRVLEPGFGTDGQTSMKPVSIRSELLEQETTSTYLRDDSILVMVVVEPLSSIFSDNHFSDDGTLVWSLENYSRVKGDYIAGITSYCSHYFYSGHGGFRLQARLDWSKDDYDIYLCKMPKRIYFSLHVLIGEFDQHLSFDFPRKCTVTVVNQNDHSDYQIVKLAESPVVDDVSRMGTAPILRTRIPCSDVEKEPYLKNDTLILKIDTNHP